MNQRTIKNILRIIVCFWLIGRSMACKQAPKEAVQNKASAKDRQMLRQLLKEAKKAKEQNVDSALVLFKEGLTKSKLLQADSNINDFYYQLATCLLVQKHDYQQGYFYAHALLTFGQEEKSKLFQIYGYEAVGMALAMQDKTDSAAYYFLQAISLANVHKAYKNIASLYRGMSNVYMRQNNPKEALGYLEKALPVAIVNKDTPIIISTYSNMSIMHKMLLDTPQSIITFEKGYRFLPYVKSPNSRMNLLVNKAGAYTYEYKYDSAKMIYILLKADAEKFSDSTYLFEAIAYTAYCDMLLGNNQLALANITKAKTIIENIDLPIERHKNVYEIEYEIYKNLGNTKGALLAKEKYEELSDSLEKSNRSDIRLKTEKELQQKEFTKDLAEKELKITKSKSTIELLFLGVGALGVISALFYFNQRKKKQLHQKNIQFLKKENEWVTTNAALQAQLFERKRISREIHDELGASLTSIALTTELLRQKTPHQTEEIDKISKTSSNMVDSLNEIIWSLNSGNDSVKSLVAYIRKMFISFLEDSSIQYEFNAESITEDIPLTGSKRRAIYLTTKEAINNVLKHAKAKVVQLSITIKENQLLIQLQDDGIGLQNLNEFGNGLKNMKHNIESIAGSIEFKNENGTRVIIRYPLQENIQAS